MPRQGQGSNQGLLVFNLAMDEADPVLGFAVNWVRGLARRFSRVEVVTMRSSTHDELPPNVRVRSVATARGRASRVAAFYGALGQALERPVDLCLVHMMPLFGAMAGPTLRRHQVRTVLWYAHKSVTLKLRLATAFATDVLTPTPESFPLTTPKTVFVGHGIETHLFTPAPSAPTQHGGLTAIMVGRVSPVKRVHDAVAGCVSLLREGFDLRVRIVGPQDARYVRQLLPQIPPGVRERFDFVGPLRREQLVAEYRRADVLVNVSANESLDKAPLEAMSCGTAVVSSNPSVARVTDGVEPRLRIQESEPAQVAEALRFVASLSETQRNTLGAGLRERVIADHDLDRLLDLIARMAPSP